MDDLVNKRVRALAADHGPTVPETLAALDKHPIELDRDQFLRRTLALELIELDQLQQAFRDKALESRRREWVASAQGCRAACDPTRHECAARSCGADNPARACGGTNLNRQDPRRDRSYSRQVAAQARVWRSGQAELRILSAATARRPAAGKSREAAMRRALQRQQ